MKDFRGSYFCQSNGLYEKGKKVKKRSKHDECECTTPFVKVHHFDCPLLKKPCPVHGEKIMKDPNRCMYISFHPSLRNDNLFQPVQNLLTKSFDGPFIKNLKSNFKDTAKHRLVQTKSEDLQNFYNNYTVEKTKLFVADKTSKIKKLKQCFQSPCESITHKSQSQIYIKEKISDIFGDNSKISKDGFVTTNKDLADQNIDIYLEAGIENDYNIDEESTFYNHKDLISSKIKIGPTNIANHHMEGSNAKSKNLNRTKKNFSLVTPCIYYTAVNYESNPLNNEYDYNKKKNSKNSYKNTPDSETLASLSEVSSLSHKTFLSKSSGSIFYTPIILVPDGIDKKNSDNKIPVISTPNLTDKDCQTSGKDLFEETSKSKKCPCIEELKNSTLLSRLPQKMYVHTQTSKHIINNNEVFEDGRFKSLSPNVYQPKLNMQKSDSNSLESTKKAEHKTSFLSNTLSREYTNKAMETFDDEGTPPIISSYNISQDKKNIEKADSKEKLAKNMKNVEVQSEESTLSSYYSSISYENKEQYPKSYGNSDQKEIGKYKTDEKLDERIQSGLNSPQIAQNQRFERRYSTLQNKNQKNTNNREILSEDSSSTSSTSTLPSKASKAAPTKVRSRLLEDEFYNVPHRPKSTDFEKKFVGSLRNEHSSDSFKNQNSHANNLEMVSAKLEEEPEEYKYVNHNEDEKNQTMGNLYGNFQNLKDKTISRSSLLSKSNALNNLYDIEDKFEKNNNNEKMSKLKSLAEEIQSWPDNMNDIKGPILQEIRKYQNIILKNIENLSSPRKTSDATTYYQSKPTAISDDVRSVSASFGSDIKNKNCKDKICREGELLNSLENEIYKWPNTMNFCKETLLEQIRKCRNSKAMLLIMSKEAEPSDTTYDEKSSQILHSFSFSQTNQDTESKRNENIPQPVGGKVSPQNLRSLSREIQQLPHCPGSCKEELLEIVRSQILEKKDFKSLPSQSTQTEFAEPIEKSSQSPSSIVKKRNESQTSEDNASQKTINKRETQPLSFEKREESLQSIKDKEQCHDELFDWLRRSQTSFKKNEESPLLKPTETQILQPKRETMETKEILNKEDYEKCKKKFKYEEEKCLRELEEEISQWPSESCKNILIRQIRKLRFRNVEIQSTEDILNCKNKNFVLKKIVCDEITPSTVHEYRGYQQEKYKSRKANSDNLKEQKMKQVVNDTEVTRSNKEDGEDNERLPREHTKQKTICAQIKQKYIPCSTESEESKFEIKKPYSYKSTAFCHTSIKVSTNPNKLTQTGEGEFTAINIKKMKGSQTTHILNSFSSSDSDEIVEKVVNKWVCKSLSDSDIFGKKIGSTNEVQLTQTYYCDPAQLRSNTSSNDSGKYIHSIFDKKQYEDDRKPFINSSESSSIVEKNIEIMGKQQEPRESFDNKEQIECNSAANCSESYQTIHKHLDEISRELMKICECQKLYKAELKDFSSKAVMTDLKDEKQEFPTNDANEEMPTTSKVIENSKSRNSDKFYKPLFCDKCAKEIVPSNDVGVNTDIPWSRPKTVEKGITCENDFNEFINETKLKQVSDEKTLPIENDKINVLLEFPKDIKPQLLPIEKSSLRAERAAPLAQNNIENKPKTLNPKSESPSKNNENKKTSNGQIISKKIEMNCENLKKNIIVTNCTDQKSLSAPKPKPKISPKISCTRIFDNSPTNFKKSMPYSKATVKRLAPKNFSTSKGLPSKSTKPYSTRNLFDSTLGQPSTSRPAKQNYNRNKEVQCICDEISQIEKSWQQQFFDNETTKKRNLKKNTFMYHAQVLYNCFLGIVKEQLTAQFANCCEADWSNKFLNDFDKNKQKRNHEKENNSDDVTADKKFRMFEFEKEGSRSDDECYYYPKKDAEEINVLDLVKCKQKYNFFQNPSFSNPDFRIITEADRDKVFSKIHKSEESLKKKKKRQKTYLEKMIRLSDKFLYNKNNQAKSTGYLASRKNNKQKLNKCNGCKSSTCLKNYDIRPIQENLPNEKAKNDLTLMDEILMFSFMFKLKSLSDEEGMDECELKSTKRFSDEK